jgi:hypothetical protein
MKKRADVVAWVEKAEQDFEGACILARKRKKPVPDLVCFQGSPEIFCPAPARYFRNPINSSGRQMMTNLRRLLRSVPVPRSGAAAVTAGVPILVF